MLFVNLHRILNLAIPLIGIKRLTQMQLTRADHTAMESCVLVRH